MAKRRGPYVSFVAHARIVRPHWYIEWLLMQIAVFAGTPGPDTIICTVIAAKSSRRRLSQCATAERQNANRLNDHFTVRHLNRAIKFSGRVGPRCYASAILLRTAYRTRAADEERLSLRITAARCVSTVLRLMPRSCAISLFE
jgi:hypothetical protein